MKYLVVPLFLLLVFNTVSFSNNSSQQMDAAQTDIESFWPYHTPYRPPALVDGIGESSLLITTQSQITQKYFNQGLSLLHCFWWFEALRAFKKATEHDKSCAMAYWGIYTALSRSRPLITKDQKNKMRTNAIKKAIELSPKANQYEQHYIQAASALNKNDRTTYVREMETLIDQHPDDVEAKLLYAGYLGRTSGGYDEEKRPKKGTIYSQSILRNILNSYPNHHGAHHYWIHGLEDIHPEIAISNAEKLAKLAPKSGHIVHMPGHIFFKTGDYQKAHQSFIDSNKTDSDYLNLQNIEPIDNWNYWHNLQFIAANCAESGLYKEGMKWCHILAKLPLSSAEKENIKENQVSDSPWYWYFERKLLFTIPDFNLRFGLWQAVVDSLIELPENISIKAKDLQKHLLLFAKAMIEIDQGNVNSANQLAMALDASLWQFSLDKSKSGNQRLSNHEINRLATASLELQGNVASIKGNHEKAIELFENAIEKGKQTFVGDPPFYPRPVQESMAKAYLRVQDWENARKVYQDILTFRPNSGYALFGIAKSYALAGKKSEAIQAYKKFLASWQHADPDLHYIKTAKTWLQINQEKDNDLDIKIKQ